MTDLRTEQDPRRERWRGYFEQTLVGRDDEVAAATDAAMEAVARGEGRNAIIAVGRAAAKWERVQQEGLRGQSPGQQHSPPGQQHSPHRPPGQPPHPARAAAPPPAREQPAGPGAAGGRPARVWPPNSAVVYMLEKRSESLDGRFFQTWSCRLLRLEGGRRPVQPPIPVEIRGRSVIGTLAEGDVVQIPYGRPGQTRIVRTLRNLSADSEIEAKGRPFRGTRTLRRTFRLFVA
jgi:hypothetical protein